MNKVILILAISIFCFLPLLGLAQYTLQATSSITINQPHYAEVDDSGRLWICEYGNPWSSPISTSIRCLDSNMNDVSFSPIDIRSQFSDSTPSGIAIASDGKVYIGNDGTTNNTNNIVIYNSDGTLSGSGYFTATYDTTNIQPGDVDFDANDNLFLVHKTQSAFSVFNRNTGAILSGCPIQGPDWGTSNINRGIAVSHDGTKVYIADTASGGLDYFEGSITGSVASYSLVTDGLWQSYIGGPAVVEIDNAGRLWVPGAVNKTFRVYDTYDNSFLGEYTFPELDDVTDFRMIGFDNDSQTLYIGNDFSRTDCTILKYTGTPPEAHATPTPIATISPTPFGFTAARCWTIYE